jgi:hypothetical protein
MAAKKGDRKRRHILGQGEMQKHRCCFCRVPMWYEFLDAPGPKEDMATYEHIVPVSEGSYTTPRHNCLVSCWLCNSLRGTQDIYAFATAIDIHGRDKVILHRAAQIRQSKTEANRRKRKARALRKRQTFIEPQIVVPPVVKPTLRSRLSAFLKGIYDALQQ